MSGKRNTKKRLDLNINEAWEPVPVSGSMMPHIIIRHIMHRIKYPVSSKKKIMVLAEAPIASARALNLITCCVHAAFAIRDAGYESIMVNW